MNNTTQDILITFAVPTYNRADYLQRCINSILQYRGKNIEVIVQDNASPDNTQAVVEEFLDDNRIQYYRNETNVGGKKNINSIMKKGKGEYVFILTDDDFLVTGGVEKLILFIKEHQPDCFKTDLIMWKEKSKTAINYSYSKDSVIHSTPQQAAQIFLSSHIITGLCFKRNLLDFNYLDDHIENYYPSMMITGFFGNRLSYISDLIAIHTWENDVFWGINPDNDKILHDHVKTVVKLTESKVSNEVYQQIVAAFLLDYNFKDADLISKLSNENFKILKKQRLKKRFKDFTILMKHKVFKSVFN